jgi:peptidoglycan/LPS O-acetylase OafA/YrhL
MEHARGSVVAGRVGRVLGTALSAIWLLIFLAGLIAGDDEVTVDEDDAAIQGVVLTALGLAAIAGFVLSFRWNRPGGLLTLVAGCLLCVFAVVTAGRNHWLAVLVSGVPWLVVAGLILLAGRHPPGATARHQVGDRPDAV